MVWYICFMAIVMIILVALWKKMKTEAEEEFDINFLIISGSKIGFKIASVTQEEVDKNDAVLDEDRSLRRDIVLWGHSSGPFGAIRKLKKMDEIFLNLKGEWMKYVVVRSEIAIDGQKNLISYTDGLDLLNNEYEFETIRLVTCAEQEGLRWVAIGRKIS